MERYRIVADVGLYYVTFTVTEWLPVFIEETACKIVTDSLNFCIQKKRLGVNAYVIMPTHVHAILFDAEFNSERLKHTRMTCANLRVVDCWIIQPSICQDHFLKHFTRRPGRTETGGFGNQPNI